MNQIPNENKQSNICPLCLKPYEGKRRPVTYHTSYRPEKTIIACNMCNRYEYLARKHPEGVPRYGGKFMARLKRIQSLSPHNIYQYRQKIKLLNLDKFGNTIKEDKKYEIVPVSPDAKRSKRKESSFKKEVVVKKYSDDENEDCAQCEGVMVWRNGKFGKFLGCSNYPRCIYTKKTKTMISISVREISG